MMKDFLSNIFGLSFFGGFMFIIGAAILYFFPPKKINAWFAYRTAAAARSQERWDFAQKFAAGQIVKASAAIIALSLLGLLFPDSKIINIFGSLTLIIAWERYVIATTDGEIKKRFTHLKA